MIPVIPIVLAGVLAATSPGVLDRVEMYRVTHQHAEFAGAGVAKLGVEDCAWLGWRGVAYVEGVGPLPVHVTDCQSEHHRRTKPLHELGLVADVNEARLNGRHAIIFLRQPP